MVKHFRKAKFLTTATMTGWAGVLLVDIFTVIFLGNGGDYAASTAMLLVIGYVIFGLPIAFMACFLLGLPLVAIHEAYKPVTLISAVIIGLSLGAIFGAMNSWFFIVTQLTDIWKIALDWLSTVMAGGTAGYVGFKKASTNITAQDNYIFD